MSLIETTQSLAVLPLEDLADQLDVLTRQIAEWRNRALLAEAQLHNRRYAPIAIIAAGAVAVILTNDGDYIVLRSIAQFRKPEQALEFAQRAERDWLDSPVNEE